jgi:hypothetical protein
MAVLETLEDLKELNTANFAGLDPAVLIQAEEEYKKQLEILEKKEDEEEIKRIFAHKYKDSNQLEENIIQSTKTNKKKANNETVFIIFKQII